MRKHEFLKDDREFDIHSLVKDGYYTLRIWDHVKYFGKDDCFFQRHLLFWAARMNAVLWVGDVEAFLRYRDLFHKTA